MLKFSDSYETYRICSQQYLQSILIVCGCMGCWGVGWGVPNPSRRTHDGLTTDQDWPGQTHLSVCNWMMLEYSDSYETYRICSKQYLHSIWIVFGCMGCWGVGWGCQHRPDGPTTDPNGNFLSPQTWLYRDMRLPQLGSVVLWLRVFTQLWNLQDMFKTIWRFDLDSILEYGGRGGWGGVGGGARSGDISRHRKFPKSCTSLYQRSPRHAKHYVRATLHKTKDIFTIFLTHNYER